MSGLRILADDLTGALDSAAAFAGSIPVYLDLPAADATAEDGVAVVATATRDLPLEALAAKLRPALHWLADAGIAFKKVDSLLRGNTFAEVAFAARAGGFERVVFAPAFPRQGRFTIGGRQCVGAPGRSADECEAIGAGLPADAFAVLGLPTVDVDAAGDALSVWIPDVRSDDDLRRIAARSKDPASRRWLWSGSGGLAHALAATHGLAPAPCDAPPPETKSGPVLLVSASHHPVVRRQWEVLRATERGAIMVTQGREAPLRAAFRAMGRSFDVAMFDLSPSRPLEPRDAAALLERQAGAIAHQAPRPGALVVVGGDTLRALCVAAGVRTLLAQASPLPGWGRAQLVGGHWDGVPCYSRSGAFGDAEDLTMMVRLLTGGRGTRKEAPT